MIITMSKMRIWDHGWVDRVYKLVQLRVYSAALGSIPSTVKLVVVTNTSNLNIHGVEARGSGSSRQSSVTQVSSQPWVHEVLSRGGEKRGGEEK